MKKRFCLLLPLLIILSIIPSRMLWLPRIGDWNYFVVTSPYQDLYIYIVIISIVFILGLVYFVYMYNLSIRKQQRLSIFQKITLTVVVTTFIELFLNALLCLLWDVYAFIFIMVSCPFPSHQPTGLPYLGGMTPFTFGLTWCLLYLWFKKNDNVPRSA